MKIIACVGYHATGAGVIDDLLREFDNVAQGQYECESRFLHDADGVSDLEYNLVENPHRLNSGYAIRRFLAYSKANNRQLSKIYGDKWLSLSQEYAKSLMKFEYNGYKGMETNLYGMFDHCKEILKRGINKIKPKKFKNGAWYNYYPNKKTIHAVCTESDFITKTQLFVKNLSECIPHNSKTEYVVMDQLVPGNRIERYLRYVNDLKVIVVDRDPRDLYIRQRTLKDHVLPNDPHQFCEYYKDIRPGIHTDTPANVLRIKFEDMIFDYKEMLEKILQFLNINSKHHVAPLSYFNPSISIKGTRMWEKYPEYKQDIDIISNELSEYLYTYL